MAGAKGKEFSFPQRRIGGAFTTYKVNRTPLTMALKSNVAAEKGNLTPKLRDETFSTHLVVSESDIIREEKIDEDAGALRLEDDEFPTAEGQVRKDSDTPTSYCMLRLH